MSKLKDHIIFKILISVMLCMGLPIVVNKFLLSPILKSIWLEGYESYFRYTIGPLLLMSCAYKLFFKYFENKKVLKLSNLAKEGCIGLLMGSLAIGSVILLLYILGALRIIGINNHATIISMLLMILALAYTEEMLFRGILLKYLEERYGRIVSLLITSLLFVVLHVSNEHFSVISLISVAAGGLLMGSLYLKTRALFLPTFFHFAWNYVQVLFGVNLSGATELKEGAIFITEIQGAEWLTGGAFGPENSLFAIAVCGSISFFLLRKTVVQHNDHIQVTLDIR